MKKILLSLFCAAILMSCEQQKTADDERFVYEQDRIVDTETGDEYMVEDEDSYTVTHPDGEREVVPYEETPFYGNPEAERYVEEYYDRLGQRKEQALQDHKAKIREARKERYSEYSNQELVQEFNRLHRENAPYEQQMDMMAELVERGAVTEEEAAEMMEVDAADINFDIQFDPDETAQEYPG
jgi:hypothetical protein